MTREIYDGQIARLAALQQPDKRISHAGVGGPFISQQNDVILRHRASRRRLQVSGKSLGIFIGKAEIGDGGVLIVGNAYDQGAGSADAG